MINEMAKQNILRCVQIWGIEGTEDKIKEIHAKYPSVKQLMLETLYNIFNFGGDYDKKS